MDASVAKVSGTDHMHNSQYFLWIQTIANVAIALTFIVYLFIWRTMRRQTRAQNLFPLLQFIIDQEFRRSRGTLVRLGEQRKLLKDWTDSERADAEYACAACDLIGVVVEYDAVDQSVVIENCQFVRDCHDAAKELLAELRRKRGQRHWKHFSALADRIQPRSF